MSQHVVILWLVTLVFSVLHNRSKTPRVVCSGSIVDICVKDNGSFSSLVYRHQASICLYSSYQKSSSSERRRRTEECQQLETFILESHLLHRPSDAEILEKPASLQQQSCRSRQIRIVALRSTWRKNAAGENIEAATAAASKTSLWDFTTNLSYLSPSNYDIFFSFSFA